MCYTLAMRSEDGDDHLAYLSSLCRPCTVVLDRLPPEIYKIWLNKCNPVEKSSPDSSDSEGMVCEEEETEKEEEEEEKEEGGDDGEKVARRRDANDGNVNVITVDIVAEQAGGATSDSVSTYCEDSVDFADVLDNQVLDSDKCDGRSVNIVEDLTSGNDVDIVDELDSVESNGIYDGETEVDSLTDEVTSQSTTIEAIPVDELNSPSGASLIDEPKSPIESSLLDEPNPLIEPSPVDEPIELSPVNKPSSSIDDIDQAHLDDILPPNDEVSSLLEKPSETAIKDDIVKEVIQQVPLPLEHSISQQPSISGNKSLVILNTFKWEPNKTEVGSIKNPFASFRHPTTPIDELTHLYFKCMSGLITSSFNEEERTSMNMGTTNALTQQTSLPFEFVGKKLSFLANLKGESSKTEVGSIKNPFASFRHPTTPIDELTHLYFKCMSGLLPNKEDERDIITNEPSEHIEDDLINEVIDAPFAEEEFAENKFLSLLDSLGSLPVD